MIQGSCCSPLCDHVAAQHESWPPQAMAKRSWKRNILTRGFHLLVMLVIGGAVKDTQCGFKVTGRSFREWAGMQLCCCRAHVCRNPSGASWCLLFGIVVLAGSKFNEIEATLTPLRARSERI